jgi:hypothetical protein
MVAAQGFGGSTERTTEGLIYPRIPGHVGGLWTSSVDDNLNLAANHLAGRRAETEAPPSTFAITHLVGRRVQS